MPSLYLGEFTQERALRALDAAIWHVLALRDRETNTEEYCALVYAGMDLAGAYSEVKGTTQEDISSLFTESGRGIVYCFAQSRN